MIEIKKVKYLPELRRVAELADEIWHECFTDIISAGQIEKHQTAGNKKRCRLALAAGIIINIGILAYLKYILVSLLLFLLHILVYL